MIPAAATRPGNWRDRAVGRLSAMTAGWGGGAQDVQLDRLRRQYPGWSIWRGRSTGDYWAMPPRGHPATEALIGARDLDELARRLAEAAFAVGGRDSEGASDDPS